MIRKAIIAFALVTPLSLAAMWNRAPLAGIAILALSHALVLIPTLTPNVQWLGPVITRFQTTRREVWLTIDDGPTEDTPALLDLLAGYGIRATFFLVGTGIERRPDLVRLIREHGHAIENHSYSHPSGSFWCLSRARIASEIDRCNRALGEITSIVPRLFRAPVGMKNPFVHPLLRSRDMILIGWSARGFDGLSADPQRVAQRIVRKLDAGTIVVVHQGRPASLATIRQVIEAITARGYSFVIPDPGLLKTNK